MHALHMHSAHNADHAGMTELLVTSLTAEGAVYAATRTHLCWLMTTLTSNIGCLVYTGTHNPVTCKRNPVTCMWHIMTQDTCISNTCPVASDQATCAPLQMTMSVPIGTGGMRA